MPDLSWAKPGDTLIVVGTGRRRAPEDATVTRVGRRWLYVAYAAGGLEDRFEIATGRHESRIGSPPVAYAPRAWNDMQHRARVIRDLEAARRGANDLNPWSNLDTDVLERALAILAAPRGREKPSSTAEAGA